MQNPIKLDNRDFNFNSVNIFDITGQEVLDEYGSDYVAISYVKGHILLTWDLGSGVYSKLLYKVALKC